MLRPITPWALVMLMLMAPALAAQEQEDDSSDAPSMQQKGGAYVLEMPGGYLFHEVLEVLKINLFDRGWMVRDVGDVDLRVRKYGSLVHNKVLRVSKPEYLNDAIDQDPMNALTAVQSILIFENLDSTDPQSYRTGSGHIVIAFLDPAKVAGLADLDKPPHDAATVQELREAITQTAAFFTKGRPYAMSMSIRM